MKYQGPSGREAIGPVAESLCVDWSSVLLGALVRGGIFGSR